MRKKLVLALVFAFIAANSFAKEVYHIGFLGNTGNAVNRVLFDTLRAAVSEYNEGEDKPAVVEAVIFDDEQEGWEKEIRNDKKLAGLFSVFSEKHEEYIKKEAKIPLVTVADTYQGFTAAGEKNRFRVSPSQEYMADALCAFGIGVLKRGSFAIIYSDSSPDYKAAAEAFASRMRANRITVDYIRDVEESRRDFTNLLLRIRDLKKQVIYFAGPPDAAAGLARMSREMNVGAMFMGMNTIGNRAFIRRAKTGANQSAFVDMIPQSVYGFSRFRPFLKRYHEEYRGENNYMPFLYDGVRLMLAGIDAGETRGRALSDWMRTQRHAGVTGTVNFRENGERAVSQVFHYIIARNEVMFRRLSQQENSDLKRVK
ncbi:MAG TPA: hypothetical protein ENN43_00655 [bacterium]|nr:hypothetical protein [bacterium]